MLLQPKLNTRSDRSSVGIDKSSHDNPSDSVDLKPFLQKRLGMRRMVMVGVCVCVFVRVCVRA